MGRSEFIWSRTAVSPSSGLGTRLHARRKPFGYYVSGDYQFGRRWFLGGASIVRARLPADEPGDHTVRIRLAGAPRDTGGSLILTYWPSEFSQIRGQLRRTHYGEGLTANEFLFQFMFSMGAHGAHPF